MRIILGVELGDLKLPTVAINDRAIIFGDDLVDKRVPVCA